MEKLINSLPKREEEGVMFVISDDKEKEGNSTPTNEQITTAKGKKWKLYKQGNDGSVNELTPKN